jgi:predicted RNase H-like HicB family nuclease
MRYAVVIENAGLNFTAYVPDLPGCVATVATLAETETAIREAIEFHLDGLREDGSPIPLHRARSSMSRLPPNTPFERTRER